MITYRFPRISASPAGNARRPCVRKGGGSERPRYVITFEARGRDGVRALRWLLKIACRRLGLRANNDTGVASHAKAPVKPRRSNLDDEIPF
jgi:hypothetical protein